jgi:3-isopropylmalate/(R)-2-methylmalate dehydratase small subunit
MTLKNIRSRVLRIYPPDTNTDEVISGKYKYDELDRKSSPCTRSSPSTRRSYPGHAEGQKASILAAANNFGCGFVPEQAPQVISGL